MSTSEQKSSCSRARWFRLPRFDYIARDCHAVGDRGSLSISRLISSARVIDNKICYDIKDANQIYELYYTRFSLHKRVYNHKTTEAIEYMVTDALLAAEPYLKLANMVDKPDKYVFLTDNLLNKIQESSEKELEPARAITERIHYRDLYRIVDYKIFLYADFGMVSQNVTPARIVEVAKSGSLEGVDKELVLQLTEEYVAVNVSVLHYGKGPRNPLDDVTFYSKQQPDVRAQLVARQTVATSLFLRLPFLRGSGSGCTPKTVNSSD